MNPHDETLLAAHQIARKALLDDADYNYLLDMATSLACGHTGNSALPTEEQPMLAFHNDPTIKAQILSGLAIHRAADEIIQGSYWENGKGCAVGCTLESIRKMRGLDNIDHSSHRLAEKETGIPQILWRLEDRIFEGLANERAKDWPEQFTSAIRPGADLSMIWPRFALWVLTKELPPYVTKRPRIAAAIADVAALYKEWCETCENPTAERWYEARNSAARAGRAYTAADAALAAYTAADAALAAYAATAYSISHSARARREAYQRQAEKLLKLLRTA